MEVNESQIQPNKKLINKTNTERAFKWISFADIFIIFLCLPAYLRFREYASEKGIPLVSASSAWWCLTGFSFMLIVKYCIYERILIRFADHFLTPIQNAEELQNNKKQIVKQSFDVFFHFWAAWYSFTTFGKTQWFTYLIGGSSKVACPDVFEGFPSWPTQLRSQIEFFILFQLGVNLYLLFELTVLKREYYSKINFYELLLHHIVATTLLLFSLINMMPIGIMILFVHDFSDSVRAIARIWVMSKYQINNHKTSIMIDVINIGVWSYTRVIVFPICFLINVIDNFTVVGDPQYGMTFEFGFIIFLCLSIFSLQSFWTVFLLKGSQRRAKIRKAIMLEEQKRRKQ